MSGSFVRKLQGELIQDSWRQHSMQWSLEGLYEKLADHSAL